MKIEKMGHIGVDVKNLDEAVKRFSDVFGITFVNLQEEGVELEIAIPEHGDRTLEETKLKIAIDRTGFFALAESSPPIEKEGVSALHVKVSNLEQAKAEMEQKGFRLTATVKVGSIKEAVYSAGDLHGIQFVLMEYEAPTLIDAILEK